MTTLGLRVDVDTLRGTRQGVPALVRLFEKHHVRASFFFSVGPDNMGRNLWRLLRPTFLKKMLRSGAPSLYGWDILLMGTAWTGPIIGVKARDQIREVAQAGHEIGLHAWDHYRWQNFLDKMRASEFETQFKKAHELLAEITGASPISSANPAWRSTDAVLALKDSYPFAYNSDCRGNEIFKPLINNQPGRVPQVPVTLPTFDEVIGRDGVTLDNFNRFILDRLKPDALNVYTIHAEVEGIACHDLFGRFLSECRSREINPVPLGDVLPASISELPVHEVVEQPLPGRDGKVAMPRQ